MKVRSGEYGSPEDVKPLPRSAKRKEAAEAGKVFAAQEDGGGIEESQELRPYNREQRGEAALEAALERGRDLRDSAMEKAGPLLAGLRSRISNFASRALGVLKTSFGIGAELKDAAIEGAKYHYEGAADFASTYADMVAPHEELSAETKEEIMQLDFKIQEYKDALGYIKPNSAARELVITQITELEAKKTALQRTSRKVRPGLVKAGKVAGAVLSAPVTLPVAAGVGLYAGGKAMKEAGGRAYESGKAWAGEKLEERAREREERRREHEEACVARAELFLEDAAEKSGEPVQKLGREQLIFLGTKLEESLARRVAGGLKELGKGITFYHDWLGEDGENGDEGIFSNLKQGALSFVDFARSPEDRAWLMSELRSANIEIGAALGDAFKTVGRKAVIEPIGRGGRAAGRLGAKAVVGTVSVGAGLAMAGAEAAINSKAGRAAKEAAIRTWEEHKPAVQRGLASTVKELNQFGDYAVDVPDAFVREVNKVATEINDNAEKALGFAARMKQRIEKAMDIARNGWNEIRRALVGEDLMAEDPETVAGIDQALVAMENLEELPDSAKEELDDEEMKTANREQIKKSIRLVRGTGTNL